MSGDSIYHSGTEGTGLEDSCPECGCGTIYEDSARGELVCNDCGCILKTDMIDSGAEWVALSYSENDEKSRVGTPVTETLHDRGMTTTIDHKNIDAHGTQLSARKRKQLSRLRTWQRRMQTKDNDERNLQLALTEIHRMSSVLEIPGPPREVAAVTYRKALDRNLIQGRSIEGVASSTLYIACRKEDIPRSLDELAAVSRVDRGEIGRTYRYLVSELNLSMEPVDPKLFVPRFCSDLDIDQPIQQRAVYILEQSANQGNHSGKSPPGLAGAAIYLASMLEDEGYTQADVADVAGVTKVTIRKRYQEQLEALEGEEFDLPIDT